MNPLVVCGWILAGVCATVWLVSLLTNEHSWVDRIWSIVPIAYVAVFAVAAGFSDARLDTMLGLVALWGVLRGRMPRWQFELFNLFFIAIYQNVLLLLISLPALTAYQHRGDFGAAD